MTPSVKPHPDLAKLQTDVALLKQFNEKVVEPTLKDINQKLDNLQFVPIHEFEEHKTEINKRFSEIKRRSWIQNTLSAVFGAILTLLATYFVRDLMNK